MLDLTQEEAIRILERNRYGRLACYSPSREESYVLPLSYLYHDGSIYLALAPGLKLDILREHPAGVCFEVDEIDDERNWYSVIATGFFSELEGEEQVRERPAALDRARHGPLRESLNGSRTQTISYELGTAPLPFTLGAVRVHRLSGRKDRWSWEADFPLMIERVRA